MFRIIKVEGESMSPLYHDGDYVLLSRIPLLLRLIKMNSVLVFNSNRFGVLIKKVCAMDKVQGKFYFTGTNQMSLTTEQIGAVDKKDIIGSVIFHFKSKN